VKNITVTVDDDVYHRARVEAARRRTSVSAVVRNYLRAMVEGRAPVVPDVDSEEEQAQRDELVRLFEEANLVLGYQPTREKTYER
jgi:plasmid stability protein